MNTHLVGDVRLACVDRGHGPPLLLIHGFPLDHRMWNAQIEALAGRCRVLAPDLRGFGASQVTPGTVSMEQMADDLAGLLEALKIDVPVVVCGLSMGGYVAWQFWCKYAERVQGLVLCDTRAAADTPEVAAGRLESAERVIREGPSVLVEGMIPKLLAPQTIAGKPQLADTLAEMIRRADPQGVAAALRGMAARPDFRGRLGQIACPTLVVVGRHDAISTVEEMTAIAAAIPAARLVEVPDAGHMSPLENPGAVNAAVLEFLAAL